MRAEIGLSTPERRIGQSAHDLQQLCGHAAVILTRALRSRGVPTVASRWLQRLASVAGETLAGKMREAGTRYLDLASAVDSPAKREKRLSRPNPKPPIHRRPIRLSVTEIETWIRDPYAIHAKYVLGLRPLPPLERFSDPLLRGQIYHDVLAKFVTQRTSGDDDALRFAALAREAFEAWKVPPAVRATWLPRFMAVGRSFLAWEAARQADVLASHCEVSGSILIGKSRFELHGRADRIDFMRDGTLSILDYKTGTNPSSSQARTLSPQLALEGNMALRGGFRIPAGLPENPRIGELAYVRLVPSRQLTIDGPCTGQNAPTVDTLMAKAWEELGAMIEA
jgi:ATP-dependent helicase/nuclease subunit B